MIWTILGLSVGILAVFCIGAAELLVGKPGFEENRFYIAGALGSIGMVFGCVSLVRRQASGRSILLSRASYWGLMLVAAAAVTVFIRPLRAKDKAVVNSEPAAARQRAPQKTNAEPERVETKVEPLGFPPLRVQGVVIRKDHAYAIINGTAYGVGDRVGKVLVKSVEHTTVTLELDGATKTIEL